MLHGIIRAATAALVFVIAILVYINYFHHSDAVLPEHTELATAPEVPKVPVSPDAVSAAPAPLAETPAKPESAAATAEKAPANPRQQRAEIIDNGEIAEVVELPPSNRPRVASVTAPAQPSATKPGGKRTHVVQPGESLWVISKKYLGNGELNAKIAECNGLTSRDRIRAGQLLIIPDLNAPTVAHAPIEPARVSEDLADDDEARHLTRISQTPNANHGPAIMNTTVRNKF